MRNRREKFKKIYGEFYFSLSAILWKHDPVKISFVSEDEYEPEVDEIIPRLNEVTSPSMAAKIVAEVFEKMFPVDQILNPIFMDIGNDVWSLLQAYKHKV